MASIACALPKSHSINRIESPNGLDLPMPITVSLLAKSPSTIPFPSPLEIPVIMYVLLNGLDIWIFLDGFRTC